LNPKLERVGFGAARKETTQTFSAMYVLDYDRNKRADYSYILYPNGGAFPLEVFDESKIWSVQLNPAEFQAPEFGKVQVTMTRLSDGRTWQINAQSSARAAEKARHHDTLTFFTTDGQIYGESHAVIFRPEMRPIMDGDRFRIRIEGLKRIDGKEAEITYETEFFSITGNKRPSLLRFEPPADVILNAGESLDVPSFVAYYSNGSYEVKEEVELSVLSGPAAIHGRQIIGKDEGTAVIEARFGHATATFQVAVQTPSQFTDIRGHWAEDTIRDAVEHHRVSGYDDGTFRPDNFVTEQEFLAMIFKWFSDEPLMVQVASFYTSYQGNHWSDLYYAYASSFRLIPMSDHRREHEMEYRSHELTRAEVAQLLSRLAGRNYADDRDAIQFLLNMGFATGKTGNSVEGFRGEDKLTRAEAVTFLKNAKENGLAFRLRSDQPEVMSERERNGAWPDLMFRTRYRDDGELILEGYDYEKAGGSLKVNIARRKSSVFSEYLATVQVPVDENGYFRSSFTGFEENVLLLYIEFAENILSYTEIERGNSRIDVGHR
jgi:hypothetical protein